MNDEPVVRAAGGIVRRGPDVLLVHRPKYDDWSFPKGKNEPGEDDATAALREVAEETGLACTLGADAGTVQYRDARGRPKVVHYFLMEPADGIGTGGFVPNHEVDAVKWCPVVEARAQLSYAHDRELLETVTRD